MITFDQFIYKWLGKKADFDGYYGGQCVDLYRFYVQEVLGFPQSPGVGGAAEIWTSADPAYYDFIKNSPEGIPKKGDIVIWDRRAGGGFGHVAINISGGINEFISLDQNFPTLDKVTKTTHNYASVIGWLRPKGQNGSVIEENMQLEETLKHFNVKDLEELTLMVDKQLAFLASERKKTDRLQKELADQKLITKAQTDALRASEQAFKDYQQTLVEKFSPDPRDYSGVELKKIVELEIDKIIQSESTLISAKSQLEKQVLKIQQEKKDEVDTLKIEIDRLKGSLEKLSDRVDDVETGDPIVVPGEDPGNLIDRLILFMAKLFTRK